MRDAEQQRVIQALSKAHTMLRLLKIEVTPHRDITKLGFELREMNAGDIPGIQELLQDESYHPIHRKILAKLMGINLNQVEPTRQAAVG